MARQFIITTTGTAPGSPSTVTFDDLGARAFAHPTSSYDLLTEFASEEIRDSADVQTAIDSGWITVVDENGTSVTETLAAEDQRGEQVPYSPTTGSDWGSPEPLEVEAALDEAADRLTTLEGTVASDELVKISSNDTTAGFLEDKVVGVTNKISITTLNDGANEDLQIDIGTDVFDKTTDTAFDVDYTPTTGANWGSPDPSEVGGALDELALRMVTVEAASGDELVKVSSNDTTAGYLEDKIVGVANKIVVSTLNDAGDEDVQITIGTDIFDKSVDDAGDVNYTPIDGTDWGSPDPAFVGPALDEAADRITALEAIPDAIYNFGAGRNSTNTSNIYLRTFDQAPMNQAPFIVPYDSTIVGITASTNAVETWEAEVHESETLIPGALLSITAANQGGVALDIDVSAGDRLMIYADGTGLNRPRVEVFLKRR